MRQGQSLFLATSARWALLPARIQGAVIVRREQLKFLYEARLNNVAIENVPCSLCAEIGNSENFKRSISVHNSVKQRA